MKGECGLITEDFLEEIFSKVQGFGMMRFFQGFAFQ